MANLRSRNIRAAGGRILGLGFKDRMRSVAAAGMALALATTGTVVIQSQLNVANAQTATESDAPIEANGTAGQKQSYSGKAWVDRVGGFQNQMKMATLQLRALGSTCNG